MNTENFSDPQKNIEQCGIMPGMDVADLGAGVGEYTVAAAKALMSTGRVYAIDVQKDLISKLKNDAARNGIYNIEVIWGDIEKPNGTKLGDNTVDLALLCNVLFQMEDKAGIINEVKRILKTSGRVIVVDWTESFGGMGPAPEMVVKKETISAQFEKSGFHLDREINAGSHHYGLIFKKL